MADRGVRLDWVALAVGLLALAASGLTLLAQAGAVEVDGLLVLGRAWLVLGLVGLGAAVRQLVQARSDGTPSERTTSDGTSE